MNPMGMMGMMGPGGPAGMPPQPPGAMFLGPGNPMGGYTAGPPSMPPICGPANGGDPGPLMAALAGGGAASVPQADDPTGGYGQTANDPLAAALGIGGPMLPGMGQMPGMPPVPMQPPAGGPPMM